MYSSNYQKKEKKIQKSIYVNIFVLTKYQVLIISESRGDTPKIIKIEPDVIEVVANPMSTFGFHYNFFLNPSDNMLYEYNCFF